ncbi:hypothetical protein [Bordetella petrii]|uniref:hypothetical protein n=1 Tax=Bordetella petrii TaxID=94624 RepID=UPI001E653FF2|nr:hypothetical protein [Bordetella petrii]MCD0502779.1 hypothetical protein [Bordetella petrii]
MPKITTPADKQALLDKMELDRRQLADAFARAAHAGKPSRGWAATTALAAGAAVGWPPFLKQPLRAMATVAVRDRLASLLRRRHVRRASAPLPDEEVARLAQLVADLRAAAERAADAQEIEHLRAQLDAHVRRLRELQAARVGPPAPPTA